MRFFKTVLLLSALAICCSTLACQRLQALSPHLTNSPSMSQQQFVDQLVYFVTNCQVDDTQLETQTHHYIATAAHCMSCTSAEWYTTPSESKQKTLCEYEKQLTDATRDRLLAELEHTERNYDQQTIERINKVIQFLRRLAAERTSRASQHAHLAKPVALALVIGLLCWHLK